MRKIRAVLLTRPPATKNKHPARKHLNFAPEEYIPLRMK
jgi:hypothetical protein